jgi:hypothetical protein
LFTQSLGGLTTPHTPEGVAYYLDQAFRAQSVAAHSAAVAMYRAALEQLLFEQGFQRGMLREKIAALEKAVEAGTAPRWANDLDAEYLKVMKDLGNIAIHPNDGDIGRQGALDHDLIAHIMATFSELLASVYEEPILRESRLKALNAARAGVPNPKKPPTS